MIQPECFYVARSLCISKLVTRSKRGFVPFVRKRLVLNERFRGIASTGVPVCVFAGANNVATNREKRMKSERFYRLKGGRVTIGENVAFTFFLVGGGFPSLLFRSIRPVSTLIPVFRINIVLCHSNAVTRCRAFPVSVHCYRLTPRCLLRRRNSKENEREIFSFSSLS